jgi:hypothetical protein
MRIQKEIDQEPLDAGLIVVDPVVLGGMPLRRVLQAVQRALPGDRRAVRTKRRQLAGEHGEGRVMTQFVVVVQILVAERQGEDALPDQRLDPMFDQARVAPVEEASGEAAHQVEAAIELPQQKRAGIRGDRPAIETRDHGTAFDGFKLEQLPGTLCLHRGILSASDNSFW